MSSSASIMKNTKPCNVTAWSYDISIQMLKDDISKLKINPTPTNREQILKKEDAIAEKKVALEKHCRQFKITYGNYGTEESEIKLEPTSGKVKAESVTDEAGVMTDGETQEVPVISVEVPVDSSVPPVDAAADAANAAALDEITFPPVTDMLNNDNLSNGVYSPQPLQPSMAAQGLINQDFSFGDPVNTTIHDPFVTSPGNDPTTIGYFAVSPSSRVDLFSSFDDLADNYIPAHANNDPMQDANYTADPLTAPTEPLAAQEGAGVFDAIAHNDFQHFGASAAPVKETGFKSDEEDEEMVMDAPVIERDEVVIPGVESYDNL